MEGKGDNKRLFLVDIREKCHFNLALTLHFVDKKEESVLNSSFFLDFSIVLGLAFGLLPLLRTLLSCDEIANKPEETTGQFFLDHYKKEE
ncbi:hypothetical protein [Methylacidiphilum caldifontis]|uniref:Uncharacterized protein n=1 Tax=Methylacidiphilum caldifontis TaxID=2795386 RepID=A0A4Y8PHL0_9BACT|nr:hypothetical protein [Methylacidiphilum caldifontis]TFE72920.1 hypothetical protein A7Q10_03355 [Methylacidiphilum caldifontis]